MIRLSAIVITATACFLFAACEATNSPQVAPTRIAYNEVRSLGDEEAARLHRGVKPTDDIYHVKALFSNYNRTWSVIYHRLKLTQGDKDFCIIVDDNTGDAWLYNYKPR